MVTGAASGIGRATCTAFSRAGARVIALDVDDTGSDELVDALGGAEGARFLKVDLGQPDQLARGARAALMAWGRVNVLVNNAAVMTFEPLADLSLQHWDRVINVNLRAPFLLAQHLLEHMTPGDSIVNITSVHAHRTTPGVVPYATAKGGLEALTRALSQECLAKGVRVNAVAPGGVDTPMLWTNPAVQRDLQFRYAPGSPEQIAAVVLFLSSEAASFMNGATVVADGGQLAGL